MKLLPNFFVAQRAIMTKSGFFQVNFETGDVLRLRRSLIQRGAPTFTLQLNERTFSAAGPLSFISGGFRTNVVP